MMAEFAIDSYTTSYLEDNCIWSYYNYHTLMYETRIGSEIKKCGYNFKDTYEKMEIDLFSNTVYDLASSGLKCEYD
jgi:hypothetical protein